MRPKSYKIRWKKRKIRAISPFKVIQGHRFWYQSVLCSRQQGGGSVDVQAGEILILQLLDINQLAVKIHSSNNDASRITMHHATIAAVVYTTSVR